MRFVRRRFPWLLPPVLGAALFSAHAAETAPADLPPDDVLERSGAVVGAIVIDRKDIFDTSLPDENKKIFRAANALHPRTRERTVRNLLLFKTGSPYSRRVLDESERLLRAQPYLYEAEIRPVRYADGAVDVKVVTRDVWTLQPDIGIGRSGGANTYHIGLQDSNFAGFGKEIDIGRTRDVDRTVDRYRYADPNIAGSHAVLQLEYQHNSDGIVEGVRGGLPFYCLDCRWSVEGNVRRGTSTESLWELGEVFDQFRNEGRGFDVDAGWSRGLENRTVVRFRLGYSYDQEIFSPLAGPPPTNVLPEDRTLAYPWFEVERLSDAFIKARDVDKIHRTEDIALGRAVRARFGWMAPAFGADRTGLIVDDAAHAGFDLGKGGRLVLIDGTFTGRFTTEGAQNVIGSGTVRYFSRRGARTAFYALFQGTLARALDADQQILIGGDNGLRGYPLRYLSGDRKVLVTIEERFYGQTEYLHLFRLGAAVFGDVGGAWFHQTPDPWNTRILEDVGAGIRFSSTRSSVGSMLHLDVAFPLNGPSTIHRVQFLFSTQLTF